MKRRPKRNPTLVAHGLARRARWHVVTRAGKAIADLYGGSLEQAKMTARAIGTRLRATVVLLDNRHTPKRISDHPRHQVNTTPARRRTRARNSVGSSARTKAARRRGGRVRAKVRTRKNPERAPIAEISRAQQVFEKFNGQRSARATRTRVRGVPAALVEIGPVVRIDYLSRKWGRPLTRYQHATKRPHPKLFVGTDGSFHLLGGKMRATDRGLVN